MCWAACDRLCKIAVRLKRDDRAHYWRTRADTIHARIMAESWSEELGHFTDTFGGHRLDASLLLLADIGFIDAMDARFIATVEAIGTVTSSTAIRCTAMSLRMTSVSRKPASPSARSGTSTHWPPSGAWTRRARCSSCC